MAGGGYVGHIAGDIPGGDTHSPQHEGGGTGIVHTVAPVTLGEEIGDEILSLRGGGGVGIVLSDGGQIIGDGLGALHGPKMDQVDIRFCEVRNTVLRGNAVGEIGGTGYFPAVAGLHDLGPELVGGLYHGIPQRGRVGNGQIIVVDKGLITLLRLPGLHRQRRPGIGGAAGLDVQRMGPHILPSGQIGVVHELGAAELVGLGQDVIGNVHITRVSPYIADRDLGILMAGEGVSISQGGEVHRLIAVQGVGQVGEGELAGDLVDGIIEGTQVLVVRFLQRPPAVAVVHRAGKAPQVDAPPQISVH